MSKTVLPSPDKLEKDHLRKVEQDVLIPKKLRMLGMQLCAEYVEGSDVNLEINLNLFLIIAT